MAQGKGLADLQQDSCIISGIKAPALCFCGPTGRRCPCAYRRVSARAEEPQEAVGVAIWTSQEVGEMASEWVLGWQFALEEAGGPPCMAYR